MATKEENKKLYSIDLTASPAKGAQGSTPANRSTEFVGVGIEEDPNAVYIDEIQRAASEKNYKTLLESDIAAYNMKMNTQKYLNNALANQGLGTQGYGTSAHVGVENQAQNLYAQNLEDYNQAESDALLAAQERQEAKATENDNQLATFLQYSDGSDEAIARYMYQYGYVQADDGQWYKGDANGNPIMEAPASSYIAGMIQSAKDNASSNVTYGISQKDADANAKAFLEAYGVNSTAGGVELSAIGDLEVTSEDNKTTKRLGDIVANELAYLQQNIGNYQDGTLIKLGRGSGAKEAYLFLLIGGKLYLVSNDDNEQAGGQVDTRYNEYNGPKTEIVGK